MQSHFRRPTSKQIRLAGAVKEQIQRGEEINMSKAGKIAGYTSRQHTHKAVQGGTFRAVLSGLIKRVSEYNVGNDLSEASARSIREGFDATVTTRIKHQGKVTDQRTYPDHATRLKYVKLYLTILFAADGLSLKKSIWK